VIARLFLGVVLALGGGLAVAQEEPPAGADRPAAREEAFKLVDAYVVSNLQEGLGLTDEQYAKAIPLVKKLQAERREYYLERTRAVREMRRLLQRGGATESQVLDLLEQVKALDEDGPLRTRKNLAALDGMLSPLQQAKYRVLELEVEQRMRELMNRVRPRTQRQGARPPGE
jgi:hypothetical protein